MAEEIKEVYKSLEANGLNLQHVMATYKLPDGLADGIVDIDYDNSKIMANILVHVLDDKIPIKLVDNVLIYIGDTVRGGAIGITPGLKKYYMLDIPLKDRESIKSIMSDMGYELEDGSNK